MWFIATDDGVVQARDIDIRNGVVYIERDEIITAMSAAVITGTTPTCPEDLLPPVLSAVGLERLREISIPWERVRFIVWAEDPPEAEDDEDDD
jgi:hypothetical protein